MRPKWHNSRFGTYRIFIHQLYKGGNFIISDGYYQYPGYNDDKKNFYYDIGLIKMEESFRVDTGRNYQAFALCLPPRNFTIQNKRIGLISGWSGGQGLTIGPVALKEISLGNFKGIPISYLSHQTLFSHQLCPVIFLNLV